MDYIEFLETKQKNHIQSGFDIPESELNDSLFPFQKFCVLRALKAGKYAIFSDCGTGKGIMQLEWAYQVSKYTNGWVLILAPLAVKAQTIREGKKFKIHIQDYFEAVKNGDIHNLTQGVLISNYEQLENIDTRMFKGIVLDESGILKNYSGVYRNLIIELFEKTEYKLACSATPSPNDELEIGNHAEFLNVMTSQDMRAMFFTTDKDIIKGEKYRLKKHGEKAFYQWISSWALMISKPSDIGFDDSGYILPGLNYVEKNIITEQRENGMLFNSIAVSATNFNSELRITKIERLDQAAEIVNNSKESFIVWIKQNEEGDYLRGLISEAVEVKGADSNEYKERNLLGFAEGDFRVLITKSKIASHGLNFQRCHNQVFASPDFSFEALYQSIRRSHRYGQKNIVNIYIITTDTMQNVINSIKEKEYKFLKMQSEMKDAIINAGISKEKEDQELIIETLDYKLILGDCVEETQKLKDNSIDYSFSSPPFGALYVFSDNPKDMSNVRNNDEFLKHYRFLIKEMFRIIKPGRLVSIHMMQSTTLLGRDGYYSIVDFRGDLIRLYQECGFYFHGENMIRKDPKTAAIRTKNRQLMWGTTKKDSSIVRPGLADYILTFRKPGGNEVPIVNNIPFDLWCKIAEPVWIDVNEGDTLDYREARADEDERHITATQLKPIEWCYLMYTNKGDTVLSPFAGISSEGWQAVKMDRKYIGIELKKSYFDLGVKNMASAIESKKQLSIF